MALELTLLEAALECAPAGHLGVELVSIPMRNMKRIHSTLSAGASQHSHVSASWQDFMLMWYTTQQAHARPYV